VTWTEKLFGMDRVENEAWLFALLRKRQRGGTTATGRRSRFNGAVACRGRPRPSPQTRGKQHPYLGLADERLGPWPDSAHDRIKDAMTRLVIGLAE
jgi:hypothetical protein